MRYHSTITSVLLSLSALHLCVASEIIVTPGPSAIGNALKSASDGDTIRVTKGTYRETICIESKVSLIGESGAVIDPSKPFRPAWQAAPNIGKGVYRTQAPDRLHTLFLDGKVLAQIDERRTAGDDAWSWKKLLSVGTPRSGFHNVRAIWIYRSDEKAVYLHLENDADPASQDLSAVWQRDAVVTFRGANGASIRGVTIAHAYSGISIEGGSRKCTVTHCVVGPWDRTGIGIGGGASENLVESNEVFRGAYEDWTPQPNTKERYEIWQIHKKAGFYDRVGINLVRAGSNNRIHANHVYETFDGIDVGDSDVENLDKPLHSPDDDRGTEIWENIIERVRDSGMELGVGCIDVRVHHNVLRQTHGGLRYKLPRIGPVFIYRNVLVEGSAFNIWYSMDDSPAEGYVYHNTIAGGSTGLAYSSFSGGHRIGAPRWHYVNNLVVTERGFFANLRVNAPVNFTADYNLVTGGGKPWPDDPAKDAHSIYVEKFSFEQNTFPPHPAANSPAIDAGLDLSTYFHGKPLPGCEPGYFKGKAPDIGAVEAR